MVDYAFPDIGRINCASEDVSLDFYNIRESFAITTQIFTLKNYFNIKLHWLSKNSLVMHEKPVNLMVSVIGMSFPITGPNLGPVVRKLFSLNTV